MARGQDSVAVIARRMHNAITEMQHYGEFDYLIVNDDFQRAYQDIERIITTYRLACARQQQVLKPLLNNLLN